MARSATVPHPRRDRRRCARPAGSWPRCTSAIRAADPARGHHRSSSTRIGREVHRARGAPRSNFLGYHGFPAVICASPNDMIVHGIPGDVPAARGRHHLDRLRGHRRRLARRRRLHRSASGEITAEAQRLIEVTEAVAARRHRRRWSPGNRIGDIGDAVQAVAEAAGFSVVREYVGHGIGRAMHEKPEVPNYGRPGKGAKLPRGQRLRRRADGQRRRARDRPARRRLDAW